MKSFKEYLTESKKVYEFKIKIAHDVEGASAKIKQALDKFKVESCSSGKRAPIQETVADFPEHKNVSVTVFDVTTAYPANSVQVRAAVAEALGLTETCVKVRNLKEQEECDINHANDEKSGEALLGKDYETNTEGQKLVGEEQKMSLLKQLTKEKHTLEQYTGVNDELFPNKAPKELSEGPAAKAAKDSLKSPVGSTKVKLPTAKGL